MSRCRGRSPGRSRLTTSPYYPQSSGKKERFYRALKSEVIRPSTPLDLDEARGWSASLSTFNFYNTTRRHSAIGYGAPLDRLDGRDVAIFAEREVARPKDTPQTPQSPYNRLSAIVRASGCCGPPFPRVQFWSTLLRFWSNFDRYCGFGSWGQIPVSD